jgi:hypothetical protein
MPAETQVFFPSRSFDLDHLLWEKIGHRGFKASGQADAHSIDPILALDAYARL